MNTTYLLGAGASYEALPIVNQIPKRLEAFANDFDPGNNETIKPLDFFDGKGNLARRFLYDLNDQKKLYEKYYAEIKVFYKDILWLKNESFKHSSIDTFAKKLYLKNDSNLEKLKYILSCFFLYEQLLKFDKRYDSFFASILESLEEIPENIKIVSWNYDSQLEIAFSNFSDSSIEKTRDILNISSKGCEISDSSDINKFKIFKVNGTTNISHRTDGLFDIIPNFKVKKESLVASFLEIYSSPKQWKEYKSNMSFAWENSKDDSKFKLHLMNSIRSTDILVVVGYSFPFFNRKMDEFILNAMKSLRKVYVQDPNSANDIIEKIKGFYPNSRNVTKPIRIVPNTDFIPKTFTDQFFIPIEF